MSERLTKRELKEDRFLDLVSKGGAYARDNVAIVVGGLVVFIAAVALAFRVGGSATGNGGPADPEAQQALSAARFEFQSGRLESGVAALESVRSQHGKTNAGREATYILANALFQSGDYARAQATFEEFLKEPLHGDLMRDGARLGVAACKEESGDLAGALTDYRTLATEGAHAGSRVQAAMSGARVARIQGESEEARRLFQQVVDAYPDAPEADDARFELLQL